MQHARLRDHGMAKLTRDRDVVVMVIIIVDAVIVTINAGYRTDAVDRVLGGRQRRHIERVRVVQTLRQIVDAQLGVIQRMPVRRRGRRRRLMRVRRRRSLRHGVVHVDSAVITAMSGDAASRSGASGVMMMVVMLLRLLLLLVQRVIMQVVMMVPAVQRARARLIIIVVMPGAR